MTQQFTGKASAYTKGRSDYPEALFDDLYHKYGFAPDSVIADIGSGTGKFCQPLLMRGSIVYAVEPNEDMLHAAPSFLRSASNYHPVKASAESTTLPDASIDHITCAAAFHWLDAKAFHAECRRILKPGGLVVMAWNVRDREAPLNRAHAEVFRRFCPKFTSLSHGFDACQADLSIFYGGKYERIAYEDSTVQDKKKFLARSLSSSYALKPKDAEYAGFVSALEELFDAWKQDGVVTVPAQCIAFIGTPHASFC